MSTKSKLIRSELRELGFIVPKPDATGVDRLAALIQERRLREHVNWLQSRADNLDAEIKELDSMKDLVQTVIEIERME